MTAKIPHQDGEIAANDETGRKPRVLESHDWWQLSTGQDARELAARLVARVDEIRKTDMLAARRGVARAVR